MITLIALFRFIAMKAKLRNQKERNNNESTDSVQKNTTSATSHRNGARQMCAARMPIDVSPTPVIDWSTEARRAIVPSSAGPENYGNKCPGEAAVYMGIVHVAIYDAAVAIEGGYEPYAIDAPSLPPNTSSAAAIATAAHHTLVGLQPASRLDARTTGDSRRDLRELHECDP